MAARLLRALASGCARNVPTPRPGTTEADHVVWTFEQVERGAIVSSPLVADDRLYVGAIRDAGLSTSGAVYCLNRETGKVLWQFDDDGEMQHMYSSPCLADGRLYIGEGMHANQVCKFYCLDAASGRKLWQEFDLPPVAVASRLLVNRRFHLKPLAPVFSEHPRLWLAIIDREQRSATAVFVRGIVFGAFAAVGLGIVLLP